MDAGLQEEKRQLRVALLPCHQPVGLYVTLPLSIFVARKFVRAVLGGQRTSGSEKGDGIVDELYV